METDGKDQKMDREKDMTKIQYLDWLRSFAILCVMLLHCMNPYILNQNLYGTRTWMICNLLNPVVRTGVPLFFMISGYLLLKSPKTLEFIPFYKKRMIRILIPFLCWDAVYYVYNRIESGAKLSTAEFLKELIVNGSEYHLWFVYTLIGIYLFLPFLKRTLDACSSKEKIWLLLLVLFVPTIRPFFNTFTPFYAYLFEPLMEGYFGFVILGYLLGTADFSLRSRLMIYAGGLAGFLIAVIGNHAASSAEGINLAFNGSYQLNHYLCASAIFVFAKQLPKMEKKIPARFLAAYSAASYGIYLIHVLIHKSASKHLISGIHGVTTLEQMILSYLITCTVSSGIMLLLSRVKYINRILL